MPYVGKLRSGGESPQTAHPPLWNAEDGALDALKGGERLHAVGETVIREGRKPAKIDFRGIQDDVFVSIEK